MSSVHKTLRASSREEIGGTVRGRLHVFQQTLRVKYGCSCGSCINGYLSPRMQFTLMKLAQAGQHASASPVVDVINSCSWRLGVKPTPEILSENEYHRGRGERNAATSLAGPDFHWRVPQGGKRSQSTSYFRSPQGPRPQTRWIQRGFGQDIRRRHLWNGVIDRPVSGKWVVLDSVRYADAISALLECRNDP
jgi:hypothetical protein